MGFELLLPVVLFILTLTIIFLLRSEDNRNQRSDLIKKKAQALLKNVENSQTLFKESAQKLEERVSKKIDDSHLLLGRVDAQLADLEARSEDLAVLQSVLVTYQKSLTQLEETTTQVEQRAVALKAEIATLRRVDEILSSFDVRFEEFKVDLEKQIARGEEQMHNQQLRFSEMLQETLLQLQEYEREVQRVEQAALKQVATHTETLNKSQQTSLDLLYTQEEKLRQMGEEGEKQMHLYQKTISSVQAEAYEKLEEQKKAFLDLKADHIQQQRVQKEELLTIEEQSRLQIQDEMSRFVQHIYGEMAQVFEMTLNKTDTTFQNMIGVVSLYLSELTLRLEQSRAATELLDSSKHTSLLSFKEDLTNLVEETLKAEQELTEVQNLEEKTSSTLALLQQQAHQLQGELAALKERELHYLTSAKMPPLSVVFAMALVDEGGKPLEKVAVPPPVAVATTTKKSEELEKENDESRQTVEEKEKRQVEYLFEEEEEIILDEDEELTH